MYEKRKISNLLRIPSLVVNESCSMSKNPNFSRLITSASKHPQSPDYTHRPGSHTHKPRSHTHRLRSHTHRPRSHTHRLRFYTQRSRSHTHSLRLTPTSFATYQENVSKRQKTSRTRMILTPVGGLSSVVDLIIIMITVFSGTRKLDGKLM